MKKLVFAIFTLVVCNAYCQDKVTFQSTDKVQITADFYEGEKNGSYVILFHQAGYSRGEYKETAPKIAKLGFNCLAVDLRSGEECNFVRNETALAAKKLKLNTGYLDAKADLLAAIDYAYNKSKKPVIIFGSSYSASLCLAIAKNNPKIKAVVAFSPGEYFENALSVQKSVKGLELPVFAASTKTEFSYMQEIFTGAGKSITMFKPSNVEGEHGSKCLWKTSKGNGEYWLSLTMFLKNQKN